MKKKFYVMALLLVLALVFSACGKKESSNSENTKEPTKTAEATKAAEPTKEAEVTKEPTKEATPEPTEEVTPEPTEEVTPEPVEEPEVTDEPEVTEEPEVTDEPVEPTEEPEPIEEGEKQVDALGNDMDVYSIDKRYMPAKIIVDNDMETHHIVSFDFVEQYVVGFDELADKKVGDTFELNGKKVTITKILSLDEDNNYTVEHDSYEDECRIVVMPENAEEFYTYEELGNLSYAENPENAEFGFVLYPYEGQFKAFSDWAWDDCYAPMYYTVLSHVNLVVNDNTSVHPCNYPYDEYGDDFSITGLDYLQLRKDAEAQEVRRIYINDSGYVHVKEVTDENGRSTGEVAEIEEIYSP